MKRVTFPNLLTPRSPAIQTWNHRWKVNWWKRDNTLISTGSQQSQRTHWRKTWIMFPPSSKDWLQDGCSDGRDRQDKQSIHVIICDGNANDGQCVTSAASSYHFPSCGAGWRRAVGRETPTSCSKKDVIYLLNLHLMYHRDWLEDWFVHGSQTFSAIKHSEDRTTVLCNNVSVLEHYVTTDLCWWPVGLAVTLKKLHYLLIHNSSVSGTALLFPSSTWTTVTSNLPKQ